MQGKYWQLLIDIQLDEGAVAEALTSFTECLTECYDVGLWNSYMRYIKMVRSACGLLGCGTRSSARKLPQGLLVT